MKHESSGERLFMLYTKVLCSLLVVACVARTTMAFAPSNNFRPYDQALHFEAVKKRPVRLSFALENGFKESHGRNTHGQVRNILAVHDDSQSLLAALNKPLPAMQTTYTNLWQNLYHPLDDGQMGNASFNGSFKQSQMFFSAAYQHAFTGLPGLFSLRLHVPVVAKKVSDIAITDLTPDPASLFRPTLQLQAAAVQAYMKNFEANVLSLGGPSYGAWQRTGLGDIACMVDWQVEYEQEKQNLKLVTLFAQLGVTIPTGASSRVDDAFSMPMGFDGAWGLPLGIGMHLDFVNHIRAGVDVDFVYLFDKRAVRRMKTDVGQTEFLLFNKGDATKEHGLQWQFHLFLQAFKVVSAFSAKVGYQFIKKDRDFLVPRNNDFNFETVNTARSLQDAANHNLIVTVDFDSSKEYKNAMLAPQLGVFYKRSLDAKGSIDNDSFGAQLALHF